MARTATKTALAAPAPDVLMAGPFASLLADGLLFASTDAVRPVLCAVHLERTKDRLTARGTDSYTAVEVWQDVEKGAPWTFLLSRADGELIIKLLRSAARNDVAMLERGLSPSGRPTLIVNCRGVRLEVTEVEGEFPEAMPKLVNEAFAKRGTITSIALNPSFATRAYRLTAARDQTAVKFGFGPNELAPASFTIGDRCRGLIMPVRVS
jgi:hypothetical protein